METRTNPIIWQGRPSQVLNANVYLLCGLGALLVVPLVVACWKWLELRSVSYQSTNETLTIRSGVLSRKIEQVELFRVKDLTVSAWINCFPMPGHPVDAPTYGSYGMLPCDRNGGITQR